MANVILDSESLITTTAIAKQLKVSAHKLHKFLHEKRIIYRIGGSSSWVPYAEHQDSGLCKLITYSYTVQSGITATTNILKWTEKGRSFIIQLWNKSASNKQAA